LNGTYDYTDQNGYPYGLYDAETKEVAGVDYDYPSSYYREIVTVGFNANYVGEKISFNSQSSFQSINDDQKIDQDFSPTSLWYVHQTSEQRLFSQELTIKSTTDSKYQHITGLFAFSQENSKYVNPSYLQSDMELHQHSDTPTMGIALYHQSSYQISDSFTALAGIRLDSEFAGQDYKAYMNALSSTDNKVETSSFENFQNFSQLTPKFTLKYEYNPNSMFYGSITRGYKAGGFNTIFETEADYSYDPEYNWNYEIGTKQSFLDGKLTADLALFYIDWRDQQVGITISGVGNVMRNAARSLSRGAEFSLTARPIQNVNITASYGFTDAKYLEYENNGIDYSDNYLILVPRHTASLQASYTFYDLAPSLKRLMFSAGITGAGKIYWDDANKYSQNFYTVMNAKISAQIKNNFTLELWAKNLYNTDYVTYMFTMSTNQFAQRGKPTSLGCSLIYKF
ncbi:MAG: TonB-dependent receptor, partial [Rikenellaceae bacterium]